MLDAKILRAALSLFELSLGIRFARASGESRGIAFAANSLAQLQVFIGFLGCTAQVFYSLTKRRPRVSQAV